MRRGGGGQGGAAALPNSGKQWGKFGQTVGEIRAKQEEKIGQRKLKDYQINNDGNPIAPPPWNVDDVTQAMSKGGCACEFQE